MTELSAAWSTPVHLFVKVCCELLAIWLMSKVKV